MTRVNYSASSSTSYSINLHPYTGYTEHHRSLPYASIMWSYVYWIWHCLGRIMLNMLLFDTVSHPLTVTLSHWYFFSVKGLLCQSSIWTCFFFALENIVPLTDTIQMSDIWQLNLYISGKMCHEIRLSPKPLFYQQFQRVFSRVKLIK